MKLQTSLFRVSYAWRAYGKIHRASTVVSGTNERQALKAFLADNPHVICARVVSEVLTKPAKPEPAWRQLEIPAAAERWVRR